MAYYFILETFQKYHAIELLQDGVKMNELNTTADSLIQCAGKCNIAFLEESR